MVSAATGGQSHLSECGGAHSSKPQYFFLDRYQESYVAEMQAFIDYINSVGSARHGPRRSDACDHGLIQEILGGASVALKEIFS